MDFVPLPRSGRLWKNKADFFRPFRNAACEVAEDTTPIFDPDQEQLDAPEPDLHDLNASLAALVDVFPDVQPEVFREMLLNLSGESRLQVVTEHLLQKKAKWVQGRYRALAPKQGITKLRKPNAAEGIAREHALLYHEDHFRSEAYKKAVKQVLYQEFRNLSRSTIKGVLAEQNFSYSLARPILQQVLTRTWRFSISNIWPKKTTTACGIDHPHIVWRADGITHGSMTPAVKRTGSPELDRELYDCFVAPALTKQREDHILSDFAVASQVNEMDAREVEALFDCECCYGEVPFEEIATCDDNCHVLCLQCVRRTVSEALYGQGWARTADLHRSTIRCFASISQDCGSCLPPDLVRRALLNGSGNQTEELWNVFQGRLTADILSQSHIPLQRCPFCDYAEADSAPLPRFRHPMAIWHHMTTRSPPAFQIVILSTMMAMLVFTVPILLGLLLGLILVRVIPSATSPFQSSWTRVNKARRSSKFQCQNPACQTPSCTRCATAWRDPHICFESEKTSLRTAIEASATAAVKRTCPRCMLSFVKSSGCNKLICNCGYTMCYICRQEITSREGYSHFCQHFRPHGGRCMECKKCDLYGDEDEEASICQAVETAEKLWKESEGRKQENDPEATRLMIDALGDEARGTRWYEQWLDAVVDAWLA